MRATHGVPRRSFEGRPVNILYRAALSIFVAVVVILEFPGLNEQRTAPDPGFRTQDLVVQSIEVDGPNGASDIHPGDVIEAIDGVRIRNQIHYRSLLAADSGGEPRRFQLRRHGDYVAVTVEFRQAHLSLRDIALPLVALFFLAVGLGVYLRRPDGLGSLFAANCAMLASFLMHRPSVDMPALQIAGELAQDAVMLFFPATLLHFFLRFPDRSRPRSSRTPRRLVAVYAPAIVLYVTTASISVRRFMFEPAPEAVVTALLAASTLYFTAYLFWSLATFVRGYRASPLAQKQKLRVVIAGSIAGFGPFAAVTIIRSVSPAQATTLELVAAVCLAFVPATFAYAILKHGAIELNAVVRKSLVYAILSAVIIASYYVVIHLVGEVVAREIGVSNAVLMPVAAIVLALVFAPAREHVQRAVDRLFYRGDYAYKQEVQDFNRQLARKLSKDEIYTCFFERVSSLLRSSYAAIYVHDHDRTLRLERSTGTPPGLPSVFSLECFLGRYLSRYNAPLMVEFLDPTWERPRLDLESRRFLSLPGLAVCVPVAAPDQFVGLAVLGEKLSGTTYRRADAELLETFADQLAPVLQNVDLVESSIEKERLKGEVMLAREIQLSLLPTAPPENPALEMRGEMVSSFEVGGDYFDYFEIDAGHIGIAIGDVSGKGVPAAMLMSSIQAVFRNLALKSRLSPAAVNAELSNHLFEHAKPDQFATFLYGVFETATSTLTFSSAGHCPALLLKRGYVDRLGKGGLVLGVRRGQDYREGVVRIDSGDLMMLYTDGVTEQKNDAGEEYGEERLIAFLREHGTLPLERLQSALIDDVVTFGSGRQDDDITTLIARHR